ncbi:related to PRY1 - strong similarity to the plant PR-1 class of pathogen related proteins [Ustilago sp. UG-2017a]|nr:related to PRY1 - strong similarity to the plant PR-1 class of pathogen related proteins [Ustilago sp. UG-2017a]
MKLTTSLFAVVGALAVLTPLSAATSVDSTTTDNLAIRSNDLEPRGTEGKCLERHRKHHHKKGKKSKKAKQLSGELPQHHKQKTSSTGPSDDFSISAVQKATQESMKAKEAALARKTKAEALGKAALERARQALERLKNSKPKTTTGGSKGAGDSSQTPVVSKPSTGGSTGSSGSTGSTGFTGSTGSTSSAPSGFASTILKLHNDYRARHSAPALVWDSTVASASASWAAGCKWAHTPNNPYGQNIAAGTAPQFGATDSATMWYDEIKLYSFVSGAYSDATGHFTQMVWKSSTKLGCAIKECSASQMGLGSSGTARYVVCNYDPPGNYLGRFLQNVLPN